MATASQSSTGAKSGKGRSAASKGPDAITLLKGDHRAVEKLFGQFEKAKDENRKKTLADRICLELRVHMQIEEEIFYPAARDVLKDDDMVDEAVVEHAAARELMGEVEGMDPGDDLYDAKVTVLQEQIEHHVEEEEDELFPKLRKTDMDFKGIGTRLKARKDELMGQMEGQGAAVQ
jgi:hemerythrin superfamily protein